MPVTRKINIYRGLNRITFLFAFSLAAYVFYTGINAAIGEYKTFSHFEEVPLFQDIPEKVLGAGYSLKLNLIKNLFTYAIGYPTLAFAVIYSTLRIAIWSIARIGRWVLAGFKGE